MSKERLEEIKNRYRDKEHAHNNVIHQRFNFPFKSVHIDDLKYLIEQAERVQELNNLLNKEVEKGYKMEGKIHDFIEQNKRYREVLEKAIEYLKRVPVGSHGVNKAYEIMIKALEEEEE